MIYTYKCLVCGERFEHEFDRVSQLKAELGYNMNPHCPKCNSTRTAKTISAPAIIYKGEGFTKAVNEE